MRATYFGPSVVKKVIKFADVKMYVQPEMLAGFEVDEVKTWPGLTANNMPTTNPANAIPYLQVDKDDDWAYIVVIE